MRDGEPAIRAPTEPHAGANSRAIRALGTAHRSLAGVAVSLERLEELLRESSPTPPSRRRRAGAPPSSATPQVWDAGKKKRPQ